MSLDAVRAHFLGQARGCDSLGSPFTARLCRILPEVLDDTTATGRRVLEWPGDLRADALALRLCGGLHNLVLTGSDETLSIVYPPAVVHESTLSVALKAVIRRNDESLNRFLDSAPQTNEVARSAMLLPGFLAIARECGLPLSIHEIGASGGLNLLFDRFHFRFGEREWGDTTSPARLAPDLRGDGPPLDGQLEIVSREGCDLSPIDLSEETARLRLQSYVWPDQPMRLERLRGALKLASVEPPYVEHADAVAYLARRLGDRVPGIVFVLFHSIMWQYMPAQAQADITALLHRAGSETAASSPIAWLRMEPDDTRDPHAMLTLTSWPDGATRKLARCDYHGRWLEWLGDVAA